MNLPIAIILMSLGAVMTPNQTSALIDQAMSAEAIAYADSVYQTLSQRERIAQLMIPHITPAEGADSKATIKKLVGTDKVGGLLFSKGSAQEYGEMTNYAQSLADIPLLMTLDGEWGAAMRIPEAPRFPYNMALGAIEDESLLYEYGKEMARECQALGIHVNFAPVLDVNSNPNNPVIGYRSFGEDPLRVSKLGVAYSLGLEDNGVMAVGKHFPGHGDTDADSHKSLPVIHHSADSLRKIDLRPFRDFILANCSGIMVGHISVPAMDESMAPSSMSNPITTGCLKGEMGFKGLVFTDGLGMKGADVRGNKCVEALKAGADVLLSVPNASADINAILKAIEDGQLSWDGIEQRCKKMLAYKYALIEMQPHLGVDVANIQDQLNAPATQALIDKLCDASVVAVHNNGKVLPISDLAHKSIAVVSIGAPKDNDFSYICSKYADIDLYDAGDLSGSELSEIKSHDIVIAGIFSEGHSAQASLAQLADAKGLVPVFLMNPYKISKFGPSIGNASALVVCGDDLPAMRRSAAKALFAGINVNGRMPVNVEGVANLGDGISYGKSRLGFASLAAVGMDERLDFKVDSTINAAIKDGAFPGCQFVVAKDGKIVIDKSYGHTTKGGKKVTDKTLYDLASVSKTVGTLPGIMKAYDLGMLDLDAPVSNTIKQMDVDGKSDLTARMLLFHETGMRPSLDMYQTMMDPDTYDGKLLTYKPDKHHNIKIYDKLYGNKHAKMRKDIASRERSELFNVEAAKGLYVSAATYDTIMARIYDSEVKPTRKYLYSCLNFCILMDLEQRVTGQSHNQWVSDSVWRPIGAHSLCYRPTSKHNASEIAATEKDTYLRKQHLQGYVHDELAAFSGGIQGNAGVFGNATDIAKLCQLWLDGGQYGEAQVYSPETCSLFIETKSPNSRRGLGFDKPDVDNVDASPTCAEASPSVFGHTGYTGTAFWVDPEQNLIFVFLCNRVDPTRSNKAWTKAAIRPTLMSLVYQSLIDGQ